ncbi:MAG: hypothetical protein WDZ51_19195 [Pirellulaceae bacterium]
MPQPFRHPALASLLCVLVPVVVLFGPGLFQGQGFVFRDAAHFYYPLFQEVQRQWTLGEVPLWNPLDGIGMPLAADATASVFYPGKLLLCLPLDYGLLFVLYVVAHFGLAYAATLATARAWGLSWAASCLAAVSYTFGGAVLGYHSNIVFLVGAAWLPLALLMADRVIVRPTLRNVIGLAVCLAMMVLGGDAQLAYHVPLIALPRLLMMRPRETSAENAQVPRNWRCLFPALGFAAAILLAIGLSAIQVLPTAAWSQRSSRHVREAPRNIYEAASDWSTATEPVSLNILAGNPATGTHERQSYDFSIGIWRWPEIWWPNFSGRMYPENHRWASAIPGEGRVWFASLYLGSLPFLLACLAWSPRSVDPRVRWLSWLVPLGMLAALGWYGIGWIIHEIGYATGWFDAEQWGVGQPLGGLYWLLNMVAPGYVTFRYPAKWWIVASLAVALLAGYGWDRQVARGFQAFKFALLVFAILSGIVGLVVLLGSSSLAQRLPETPPDGLFGPLDAKRGLQIAGWGILQTTLVLGLAGAAIVAWRHCPERLAWAIVALVTVDLLVANHHLVQYAPRSTWTAPSLATQLPRGEEEAEPPSVYRRRYETYYPSDFARTSSPNRQREAAALDRWGLFPRYHLLDQVRILHPVMGIAPADYDQLLHVASDTQTLPQLLELLGAQYVVQPAEKPIPRDFRQLAIWKKGDREVALWQTAESRPPAWFVENAVQIQPPGTRTRADLAAITRQVWFAENSRPRGWADVVVLEAVSEEPLPEPHPGENGNSMAEVHLHRPTPSRMEITVDSPRPGYLVIREYFDSGWRATVRSLDDDSVSVTKPQRANRVMQAIPLAAGKYQVSLAYRPSELYWGTAISGLAWLGILLLVSGEFWWRVKSGNSAPR